MALRVLRHALCDGLVLGQGALDVLLDGQGRRPLHSGEHVLGHQGTQLDARPDCIGAGTKVRTCLACFEKTHSASCSGQREFPRLEFLGFLGLFRQELGALQRTVHLLGGRGLGSSLLALAVQPEPSSGNKEEHYGRSQREGHFPRALRIRGRRLLLRRECARRFRARVLGLRALLGAYGSKLALLYAFLSRAEVAADQRGQLSRVLGPR